YRLRWLCGLVGQAERLIRSPGLSLFAEMALPEFLQFLDDWLDFTVPVKEARMGKLVRITVRGMRPGDRLNTGLAQRQCRERSRPRRLQVRRIPAAPVTRSRSEFRVRQRIDSSAGGKAERNPQRHAQQRVQIEHARRFQQVAAI